MDAVKQAHAFVKEHLKECCEEILEWNTKCVLRNGKVRQIDAMLKEVDKYHSLSLAETIVKQEAMLYIANL